ncbi:hypothetical protein VNI00_018938 [Paramarasmius palmivorus]|uniref:F-box domain-containing protein n=1 Tax=Paramarasmius palmivorus TaxID=297713 RepID=A0AAW0AS45_9AGAR
MESAWTQSAKREPTNRVLQRHLLNDRRPVNRLPREILEEAIFLCVALIHLAPASAADQGYISEEEEGGKSPSREEDEDGEGDEDGDGEGDEDVEGEEEEEEGYGEDQEGEEEEEGMGSINWRAHSPFRLSQVCHLWRQICQGSSRVWQFIDLAAKPCLSRELFLRSREGPLSIKAMQKYPFNEEIDESFVLGADLLTAEAMEELSEILSRQAHRITRLRLFLSANSAQRVLPEDATKLSSIKELQLTCRDPQPMLFDLLGAAPATLACLSLRRIAFSWGSPAFGRCLTFLFIESPGVKPSVKEMLDVLRQSPQLQSVQLIDFEPHQPEPCGVEETPFGPVGQALVKSLELPWWASIKITLPLPQNPTALRLATAAISARLPDSRREAYNKLEIRQISEEGKVFLVEENGYADYDVSYRTGISWCLVTRPEPCPDNYGVRCLAVKVVKPFLEGEENALWKEEAEVDCVSRLTSLFSPSSARILQLDITPGLYLKPSTISSLTSSPSIKHLVIRRSLPPPAVEAQALSPTPLLPGLQQLTFYGSMDSQLLLWIGARREKGGSIEQLCWVRSEKDPGLPFWQTDGTKLQEMLGPFEFLVKFLRGDCPDRKRREKEQRGKRVGGKEKQGVLKEVGMEIDAVREVMEVVEHLKAEREEVGAYLARP